MLQVIEFLWKTWSENRSSDLTFRVVFGCPAALLCSCLCAGNHVCFPSAFSLEVSLSEASSCFLDRRSGRFVLYDS